MARQTSIAIISTACRFPDAGSPAELWTNAMDGRRSFRAIPKQRLDMTRYLIGAVGEADSITQIRAGLLTNWNIDRSILRIPKKTFDATDLTHWLALELAAEALAAAGGIDRFDRKRTAVIVANTLAGEFSRTSMLRLRAPFIDELLAEVTLREGLAADVSKRLRGELATELRRRFPDPNEDSLAGGLANTIAGRIANYFDLHGGCYSVDAACASSLVALAHAATLLASEQVDAVVVAAVDLSLDPFELVGFSRNGALAAGNMRVFDARANGFWPGEGGACAVLMRKQDTERRGLAVQASIRGWGLSSDGAGGLTRPSMEGQLTAYRRAYEMAQLDPVDVEFVEAHGTGTVVGDPIEVRALAALRRDARRSLPIGSIKANIGHTKAAAGFAGLIKVIETLRRGVIPPHVSCEKVHPVFAEIDRRVYANVASEPIGSATSAFAGVSSFGFGGINAHLVIERAGAAVSRMMPQRPPVAQDAELFLFAGHCADEVIAAIAALEDRAPTLSMAELSDAAAHAASSTPRGPFRAAIVAAHGAELASGLARAKAAVAAGDTLAESGDGVFVRRVLRPPRIGFLFPGQGAPSRPHGGAWQNRFPDIRRLIARLPPADGQEPSDTSIAQPCIVAASLAGILILERLGISAGIAAGHSLGEISALAWARVLEPEDALALAIQRGSLMAKLGAPGGTMLRVAMPARDAMLLAEDTGTLLACRNGDAEAVLSGTIDAVARAAASCRARGVDVTQLAVSHAFHSPDMAAAALALAAVLRDTPFQPLAQAAVVSTISGTLLTQRSNLRELLIGQLTRPVLFDAALDVLASNADFLVEVGPGQALTHLARANGATAFSIDAFADSVKPLLSTVAAVFAAGADIRAAALVEDRCARPFDPAAVPVFIESPCGSRGPAASVVVLPASPPLDPSTAGPSSDSPPLTVVLSALARETGLQVEQINPDDRFLDALHLNSLAVTRIVVAAARMMELRLPSAPTEFANATARQVADALTELRVFGGNSEEVAQRVAGVRPWIRLYATRWLSAAERASEAASLRWCHMALGEPIPSLLRCDDDCGLLIRIDGELDLHTASDLVALAAGAARLGVPHLAFCHRGAPISAFARSIAREGHFRSVKVIDRASFDADDARINAVLSRHLTGFDETRLGPDGGLLEPVFGPAEPHSSRLDVSDEVVVIIGGGKGIAAECALQIGRRGATIILVGRSPAEDPDVAATLARAQRSGLLCRYVCADVLNGTALFDGLAAVLATTGPATMLVYSPAINEPRRLTDLDIDTVRRTLAPKTSGLQSALLALGPELRRLITFGSIIGRIGLEGESHYALANAMQTAATEAWAAALPGRAALAIEWSVWAGAGMGERLGTTERLSSQGVDALSLDDALGAFERMIATGTVGTVAITSRFGPPPDLPLGLIELPMLRFIDNPLIVFPGTEFVIESTLSFGRDPYLDDHAVGGHAVLPAVMGLEAMAQVASALVPLGAQIAVSDIEFCRALHVPANRETRIRIAALRNEAATTEVILYASDDNFSAPCMRASFSGGVTETVVSINRPTAAGAIAADPLYGPLFFNRNRFRRLQTFDVATSRHVSARLRPANEARWFGAYEASGLALWDPGATDAALHALQVAVPHRRVLPIHAVRVTIDTTAAPIARIDAIETNTTGHTYTFDLLASDINGRAAQRWTDVTFRAIERTNIGEVLIASPDLVTPYLERMAREAMCDESIVVAFVQDRDATRDQRRNIALARLGLSGSTERRGDGRPIRIDGEGCISMAHHADATLAIAARDSIGCDIEAAGENPVSADSIRRHVAYEACRKVGRKPSPGTVGSPVAGIVDRIDDVIVVTIELPLPSGPHLVAFSRLDRAARPQLRPLRLRSVR